MMFIILYETGANQQWLDKQGFTTYALALEALIKKGYRETNRIFVRKATPRRGEEKAYIEAIEIVQ